MKEWREKAKVIDARIKVVDAEINEWAPLMKKAKAWAKPLLEKANAEAEAELAKLRAESEALWNGILEYDLAVGN